MKNIYRIFPESKAVTLTSRTEVSQFVINNFCIKKHEFSFIEAGQTYIGQMISHDIVDVTNTDPNSQSVEIRGQLNLDSLYGYVTRKAHFDIDSKFILGSAINKDTTFKNDADLLRDSNGQALIPEPRNDENIIVSQLHLLWQKLHNKIVDYLLERSECSINLIETTRKYVVTIFHEIVLQDFMFQVIHPEVYALYNFDDSSAEIGSFDLKLVNDNNLINVPLEFSHAIFRFGHSMVRDSYVLNSKVRTVWTENLIRDVKQQLNSDEEIVWSHFFELPTDGNNKFGCHDSRKQNFTKQKQRGSAKSANMINMNIVEAMTKIQIGKNVSLDIRKLNILANSKRKIINANEIHSKLKVLEKFKKLIRSESSVYKDIFKNFKNLNLWTFTLLEAETSRMINKKKCQGLGIIGSVVVSEVLIKSIYESKKLLNINNQKFIEDFIKNKLLVPDNEKLRMGHIINYINPAA